MGGSHIKGTCSKDKEEEDAQLRQEWWNLANKRNTHNSFSFLKSRFRRAQLLEAINEEENEEDDDEEEDEQRKKKKT